MRSVLPALILLIASFVSADAKAVTCSDKAHYVLQQCIIWVKEMKDFRNNPDLYERWELKRMLRQATKCTKFYENQTRTEACLERMIEEGTLPDVLIPKLPIK